MSRALRNRVRIGRAFDQRHADVRSTYPRAARLSCDIDGPFLLCGKETVRGEGCPHLACAPLENQVLRQADSPCHAHCTWTLEGLTGAINAKFGHSPWPIQ